MQKYELMYLLDEALADKELEGAAAKVNAIIEGQGGKIIKQDLWGVRSLTYPIKKHRAANYVVTIFEIEDTGKLSSLKRKLRLDESVIRSLIIKYDEATAYTPPTPEEVEAKKAEAEKAAIARQEAKAKEAAEKEMVIVADSDKKKTGEAATAAMPAASLADKLVSKTASAEPSSEKKLEKKATPEKLLKAKKPADKTATIKTDIEDLDKKLDEILDEKDL